MFHSRLISCLIQLSKCAVYNQFSLTIFTHFFFILPIEFTMMHLGQLHRRVFNFIRCWSLKMAKRFSIAYNCKKNKTKQNTKWKRLHKKKQTKKMRETKLDRKKINKIWIVRKFAKSPEFLKHEFWQLLVTTVQWR